MIKIFAGPLASNRYLLKEEERGQKFNLKPFGNFNLIMKPSPGLYEIENSIGSVVS